MYFNSCPNHAVCHEDVTAVVGVRFVIRFVLPKMRDSGSACVDGVDCILAIVQLGQQICYIFFVSVCARKRYCDNGVPCATDDVIHMYVVAGANSLGNATPGYPGG